MGEICSTHIGDEICVGKREGKRPLTTGVLSLFIIAENVVVLLLASEHRHKISTRTYTSLTFVK